MPEKRYPKWYIEGGGVKGWAWIDTSCPYDHRNLPQGGQCRGCLRKHYGFDPLVVGYPRPPHPIQTYVCRDGKWVPSKVWK